MNSQDIARLIYEQSDKKITLQNINKILDKHNDIIKDALVKSATIELTGLGSFTLNSNTSTALSFNVSDAQDPTANLKIKLNTLPTCGSIVNSGMIAAVLGQNYNVRELTYKACSTNITNNITLILL